MAFNYNKLWDILKKKNITKDELRNKIGASQTTIVKMGRNENVSLDIIDRICDILECTPDDIMSYKSNFSNDFILPKIKRGDVFRVNFETSSISKNIRPAVVIENNELLNENKDTIMFAPFSTFIRDIKNTHIRITHLDISDLDSLPSENTIIAIEKMSLIKKSNIYSYIGTISETKLKEIDESVSFFLGLNNNHNK